MNMRAANVTEQSVLASIAISAKSSWGYSSDQIVSWREGLSPTAESIHSQPTFVAEINGEIVGFYQCILRDQMAHLEHLWVLPKVMRQGIGRALVAHAVGFAAGYGIGSLSIDSDPHAEPFYASCGAIRMGLRPAPIAGQPDRVLPQLVLATTHAPNNHYPPG